MLPLCDELKHFLCQTLKGCVLKEHEDLLNLLVFRNRQLFRAHLEQFLSPESASVGEPRHTADSFITTARAFRSNLRVSQSPLHNFQDCVDGLKEASKQVSASHLKPITLSLSVYCICEGCLFLCWETFV